MSLALEIVKIVLYFSIGFVFAKFNRADNHLGEDESNEIQS